jgi:long-subunit acyl-CoA synthetase (AMP-forming)
VTQSLEQREIREPSTPDTLGRLHLVAERKHDREAVLQTQQDGKRSNTPDWRFDRQVIRVGLYMHERLGLKAGDRIALLGALRPEWIVADWAAVTRGIATVVVEGPLSDAAWVAIHPQAVFLPTPEDAEALLAVLPLASSLRKVIVFEGRSSSEKTLSFSEVLDLGGTLDTAERANAFRDEARQIPPDAEALAHARARADDSLDIVSLTHRDVVERLKRHWSVSPPRKGRTAHVGAAVRTLSEHVALYGAVVDGLTCTALGTEVES